MTRDAIVLAFFALLSCGCNNLVQVQAEREHWNGGNNMHAHETHIIPFSKFRINAATKSRTDDTLTQLQEDALSPHAGKGGLGEKVVNLQQSRQDEIISQAKNAVAGRVNKIGTPKYTVNDITTANDNPIVLGPRTINIMPYQ